MNPCISVVIPTLNEEKHLPALLRSLTGQRFLKEIIVIDGGSTDNTRAVASEFHVIWGSAAAGRSRQMNAGASLASGNILLFLHADTVLPEGALESIIAVLERGNVAGTFRISFDSRHPLLMGYAWFTRINSPLFIFGDQGLFLYSELFHKIGGFADLPIMEDVEIIRRLKRQGRIGKSGRQIITSARRFRRKGIVRQQLRNSCLLFLYSCGVSPAWLGKRYWKEH